MKEDTKKLIVLGGLGAVAIYFLMPKDEGYAGFGGGGGIPLLPGDTEGAAEGDTYIEYILGGDAEDPFGGFDVIDPGDPDPYKKTTVDPFAGIDIGIKPLEYYKQPGGVSVLSEYATPAQKVANVMSLQHYRDPVAVAFSGRTDAIDWGKKGKDVRILGDSQKSIVKSEDEGAPWYNPFAWNWSEAAENYQAWATRSTERTLGREPSKDIRGAVESKKIVGAQSVSTKRTGGDVLSKISLRSGGGGGGTYPTSASGRKQAASDRVRSYIQSARSKKSRPGQPD